MRKANSTSADNRPDWEQTSPVDPRPTWRPTSEQFEINAPHREPTELPPLGYPISEEAVMHWVQLNIQPDAGRGGNWVILDAMARRDADQPATEPPAERVFGIGDQPGPITNQNRSRGRVFHAFDFVTETSPFLVRCRQHGPCIIREETQCRSLLGSYLDLSPASLPAKSSINPARASCSTLSWGSWVLS